MASKNGKVDQVQSMEWITVPAAMKRIGWNTEDKPIVTRFKNALRNRAEFKGATETRKVHPELPYEAMFINPEAVDAFAKAIEEKPIASGPTEFWYRSKLDENTANALNALLEANGYAPLERQTASKATGAKRGRRARNVVSSDVVPTAEDIEDAEEVNEADLIIA